MVATIKIDHSNFVHIYRYGNDGYNRVWSYVIPEEGKRGGVTSITTGDADNDGDNEVVAGTSCWNAYDVRILEYKGVYKNSWRESIGYTLAAATGNLNNDSKPEILAGKGFGQGGCFPVIGNLVGNEANEFAFPMNTNKIHKTVYVYGLTNGQFKQLQAIEVTPSSLFIGDSNNNGVNELLICDSYHQVIKVYEKQEEKKKDKPASKRTSTPEEKDIVSKMNNVPGFEVIIAFLGIAIALIRRKWR